MTSQCESHDTGIPIEDHRGSQTEIQEIGRAGLYERIFRAECYLQLNDITKEDDSAQRSQFCICRAGGVGEMRKRITKCKVLWHHKRALSPHPTYTAQSYPQQKNLRPML